MAGHAHDCGLRRHVDLKPRLMKRDEDCRDPQRANAYALEESTAEVEAVGLDGEQRVG